MIKLVNVNKSFGSHEGLKDLNLTINTGESMVIIGRSGCGKSVLLKHIIVLMRPDSGSVIIDGTDITHMSSKELNKVRMNFGMLLQGAALFDSLSVLENVGFRLFEYTDKPLTEIEEEVSE